MFILTCSVLVCRKNAHPLFGICAAHRHHPYKRGDRFLVLLVALCTSKILFSFCLLELS